VTHATVRDAAFDVLRRLDLTTIFSNPGSTEVPFLVGMPEDVTFVLGLHEGSVVAMAAGYAIGRDAPALALLHRPLFPGTTPEDRLGTRASEPPDPHRESIWISYRSMAVSGGVPEHLCHFTSHHQLAYPQAPWEQLKIGGGAPPILTRHGWLIIYHGVSATSEQATEPSRLRYSAGMMMLSAKHPHMISYRSAEPILAPVLPEDRRGAISDVVFPTGIDRRDDLGQPDRFDVYYGMADRMIGVARLDLPDTLPPLLEGEGETSAVFR